MLLSSVNKSLFDCIFRMMANNRGSSSKSQTDICACNKKEESPFEKEARTHNFSWLKYRRLYAYNQVPKHLQTNSFILNGYRYNLSWSECVASFFLFHNETLNIWTHFAGFLLFTSYFLRDFISSGYYHNLFSTANTDDYLMLLFYVLSIIFCMIASTMLHLLSGCSAKLYTSCLQLDLFGVSVATLASFFIGLHLLFKCHLYTRIFYQLAIILLIIIVTMHLVLKHDDTIDSKGFIAVILAGFIPLFHWVYMNGYSSDVSYFFSNVIMFYVIFGAGVFFFRTKIPERFAPGYFDYVGASHQLWHIFSLIAFYWWYNNSVELIKYHQTHACITAFATTKEIN
jgi:predicted membrane channel-forming protein YqfA (hemolysin III family)